MLNIEVLRVIWWVLLGVLFMGFAIMDGFDLGAAALFPLVARDETERRIVLNVIGPIWEGNQVWLITGAGAIFAAWPLVYAVAFSGFYLAMFLALGALILRPVAIVYRSKAHGALWRLRVGIEGRFHLHHGADQVAPNAVALRVLADQVVVLAAALAGDIAAFFRPLR